jgi:ribosomal protein L2
MKRTNVSINTKDYSLKGSPTTYSITISDQSYYEHYYGRRTTLSIGDVLPLHGILEGAVICNIEHHVGSYGALVGASRDYTIIIRHNPDKRHLCRGV